MHLVQRPLRRVPICRRLTVSLGLRMGGYPRMGEYKGLRQPGTTVGCDLALSWMFSRK